MTKQLTPLRRKDQATGYAKAVKEIVAWLRDEDCRLTDGGAITDADYLARQIAAKFGGDNGQRNED